MIFPIILSKLNFDPNLCYLAIEKVDIQHSLAIATCSK